VVTRVAVTSVDAAGVLRVRGVDMLDGSAVLDVKAAVRDPDDVAACHPAEGDEAAGADTEGDAAER
jgi:tRNA (Thr-GGU) A37 N-methylase